MSGSRVLVALRIPAAPQRTFDTFVGEIGDWWNPNGLFGFSGRPGCRLAFEPRPPTALVEIAPDGGRFEIGRVSLWEPPRRLKFGGRQASFPEGVSTEASVTFEDVGEGTRVTVEHFGWDAIPQEHAARHGFPLFPFEQRLAEWWQVLLQSVGERAAS